MGDERGDRDDTGASRARTGSRTGSRRDPTAPSRRTVLAGTSWLGAAVAGGIATANGLFTDSETVSNSGVAGGTLDLEVTVDQGGHLDAPDDRTWTDGTAITVDLTPTSASGERTIGIRSCSNPARPVLTVGRAPNATASLERALHVTLTYRPRCPGGDSIGLFSGSLRELLENSPLSDGAAPGDVAPVGRPTGSCFCLGKIDVDDLSGTGPFTFDLDGDGTDEVEVQVLETKPSEPTEKTKLMATLLDDSVRFCEVAFKYGRGPGGATGDDVDPICGGSSASVSERRSVPDTETVVVESPERAGALSNVQFAARRVTTSTPVSPPPLVCSTPACLVVEWSLKDRLKDELAVGDSAGFDLEIRAIQERN